jgi:PKD repeat protein
MVLASFSNVISIQTDRPSKQKELKNEIDSKEPFSQTNLDIPNKSSIPIQRSSDSSTVKKAALYPRYNTVHNTPKYLVNITEKDIFRNGVDTTVFNYPNDLKVINGIGYAVACYSNSLVIIDLKNESNIIQTTYKQDDTFLYQAHGIEVTADQKYAYTVTYGSGSYLGMWNVTDIYTIPERLNQSYIPSETGMYLEIAGNYLILTTKSKIHIYDITNRNTTNQMTELSSFSYSTVNSSTYYWHTMVVGNFLYVASSHNGAATGGFVVFNITNKSNPTEVRRVNETINFVEIHQYYWHGFHYLLTEGQEVPSTYFKGYIYVYNFSSGTLDNPTFLYRKCTVHNGSWFAANQFNIINGYVFSMQKNWNTTTYSGIQVWNLTDINNPSYVTGLNGNGPPYYLNMCHCLKFDQNGSDRTLYIITQNDDDLVTINLTWAGTPHYPPIANFTYTIEELSVTFNASSSNDPDGNITSWHWKFGDTTDGVGKIVTHTYPASGTYNVTLTVTDDDGLDDSVSQEITVEKAPEFQTAFIFGRITNLSIQDEFITFNAIKTRMITFKPFSFNTYQSDETFTISKEYKGLMEARFVVVFCKLVKN